MQARLGKICSELFYWLSEWDIGLTTRKSWGPRNSTRYGKVFIKRGLCICWIWNLFRKSFVFWFSPYVPLALHQFVFRLLPSPSLLECIYFFFSSFPFHNIYSCFLLSWKEKKRKERIFRLHKLKFNGKKKKKAGWKLDRQKWSQKRWNVKRTCNPLVNLDNGTLPKNGFVIFIKLVPFLHRLICLWN